MSSREEKPGRLRPEPEVSSASGGHLAPDTGGLFDPLNEPLPSEVARRADPGGPPTETFTRAPVDDAPMRRTEVARQPAPARRVRRKTGLRRVKRTIKHVHPLSVLKLSLFFYACFMVAWLFFGFIVYSILRALDVLKFVKGLCSAFLLEQCDKTVTLGQFERWVLVVGLIIASIGILMNTLMAVLYNVGADLFGGVEVTFVEKDL